MFTNYSYTLATLVVICILWFVFVLALSDLKEDTQEVKLSLWSKSLGIEFKMQQKNTFYILLCPDHIDTNNRNGTEENRRKKINERHLLSIWDELVI